MKAFFLSLLFAASCCAQTVQLAWDAPASTGPLFYYIYAGTNSSFAPTNYTVRVDAGTNLTCTVSNIVSGYWVFAATARDTNGLESDFSTTVSIEVPTPPKNMRTVVLQYSGTLTNFYDVGFFRLRFP